MAKRALLAGINQYKYARSLKGCVNDVHNIIDILTNIYGFSSNEIRTLLNENVTRNSLVNQLSWFLDKLKEGDVLFFYFSGYGSTIRVQEFDGKKHEDHFEEALCLYDIDFRNPDTFLLDDDFNCILDLIPNGVSLTICIDSCHSGPVIGDLNSLISEKEVPLPNKKTKIRFMRSQADPALTSNRKSINIKKLCSRIRDNKACQKLIDNNGTKHILLTGCKDGRLCLEDFINRDYCGAFTYTLCKMIRDTEGLITYHDLIKKVQKDLESNCYNQSPQVYGNNTLKSQYFLSGKEIQ